MNTWLSSSWKSAEYLGTGDIFVHTMIKLQKSDYIVQTMIHMPVCTQKSVRKFDMYMKSTKQKTVSWNIYLAYMILSKTASSIIEITWNVIENIWRKYAKCWHHCTHKKKLWIRYCYMYQHATRYMLNVFQLLF